MTKDVHPENWKEECGLIPSRETRSDWKMNVGNYTLDEPEDFFFVGTGLLAGLLIAYSGIRYNPYKIKSK